jgi:hypothetical protein
VAYGVLPFRYAFDSNFVERLASLRASRRQVRCDASVELAQLIPQRFKSVITTDVNVVHVQDPCG